MTSSGSSGTKIKIINNNGQKKSEAKLLEQRILHKRYGQASMYGKASMEQKQRITM